MQKLFLIISMCILCVSCGVKGDPEYKSQKNYSKTINLT